MPRLGQLFLLNLVSVRAAFPVIRVEAQGSGTRGPGRNERLEPTAHTSVVAFHEDPRLHRQHTFVPLPGMLAFFFPSNGRVCVKREGRQGKNAAAPPLPL